MAFSPSPSPSQLSASRRGSIRMPASTSALPAQKYLLQRVRELEKELESKRLQLFESEEARDELEKRLEEISVTPATSTSYAASPPQSEREALYVPCPDDCVCEWCTREEQHRQDLLELHTQNRDQVAGLVGELAEHVQSMEQELESVYEAEIAHIKQDHEVEKEQRRANHEAEYQANLQDWEQSLTFHHDKVTALESGITADLLDADKHKADSDGFPTGHAKSITALKKHHEAEMFQLRTKDAAVISSLQEKFDYALRLSIQTHQDNIAHIGLGIEKLKSLLNDAGSSHSNNDTGN